MRRAQKPRPKAARLSAALCCAAALVIPIVLAAASPLQSYRSPPYIIGGLAGVTALSLLALQPLLAANGLAILRAAQARRWHRRAGRALLLLIALHVLGLYIASPADALDALLLRSPTPFSVYGVAALCGAALIGLMAAMRRRLPPRLWQLAHLALAAGVTIATVVHALMIEGTMEQASKWMLCALAVTAALLGAIRILRR
ncbi:ferric reductase-like transmembrane domain-containing protein [Alphaproteobacteria bacterium KMM 3653]|uniref:Ferric reductase-like transmembrane domain-containing protein n=1 Tax=Harenicola maris TaxID=2841044 RepID=A0AAP2G3I8_9RHOB|nr:ferric reductase-like transmembrane domain-containing protein [Harenicola maris]